MKLFLRNPIICYVCAMGKQPRLTKGTYDYLDRLAKEAGTNLYQITRKAGLNHQVLTKWKTADPKTCEILDCILQHIRKENLKNGYFEHNEAMLARFEINTTEHGIILDRLTRD